MSRLDDLLKRYKWLQVALWIIPVIYGGIVWFITKTTRKTKAVVLLVTLLFGLIYAAVVYDFFETKREIQELQQIRLTIKELPPGTPVEE